MIHPLLSVNDPAWFQASLPVKFGGLSIRSAVTLAPSTFLASTSGAYDFITQILPDSLYHANYTSFEVGLEVRC